MKIIKLFLVFTFLLASFFVFLFSVQSVYLPSPDLIGEKIVSGGTEIYDRTGKILLYKVGFRRSWVNFEDIPENIIKAILIAEDEDFYSHHGISLKGILRSIYLNIKTKSFEYGGSTITQQLARNLIFKLKKKL
jgi:membrane peptidoglycan carboxypeptidase